MAIPNSGGQPEASTNYPHRHSLRASALSQVDSLLFCCHLATRPCSSDSYAAIGRSPQSQSTLNRLPAVPTYSCSAPPSHRTNCVDWTQTQVTDYRLPLAQPLVDTSLCQLRLNAIGLPSPPPPLRKDLGIYPTQLCSIWPQNSSTPSPPLRPETH